MWKITIVFLSIFSFSIKLIAQDGIPIVKSLINVHEFEIKELEYKCNFKNLLEKSLLPNLNKLSEEFIPSFTENLPENIKVLLASYKEEKIKLKSTKYQQVLEEFELVILSYFEKTFLDTEYIFDGLRAKNIPEVSHFSSDDWSFVFDENTIKLNFSVAIEILNDYIYHKFTFDLYDYKVAYKYSYLLDDNDVEKPFSVTLSLTHTLCKTKINELNNKIILLKSLQNMILEEEH